MSGPALWERLGQGMLPMGPVGAPGRFPDSMLWPQGRVGKNTGCEYSLAYALESG